MSNRKSRPDAGTAQSESPATIIRSRITSAPEKTPEQRREQRIERFGKEITVLLECDERRHNAEARYRREL